MKSLSILIGEWKATDKTLRFGQYFCNYYIKNPWPTLYYCTSFDECCLMIGRWLTDNQYIKEIPLKVKRS